MRVFVDEHPVTVAPGATAVEAIAALDRDMQRAIADGSAYVTGGTGAVVAGTTLATGSILRVVRSTPSEPTRPSDA